MHKFNNSNNDIFFIVFEIRILNVNALEHIEQITQSINNGINLKLKPFKTFKNSVTSRFLNTMYKKTNVIKIRKKGGIYEKNFYRISKMYYL